MCAVLQPFFAKYHLQNAVEVEEPLLVAVGGGHPVAHLAEVVVGEGLVVDFLEAVVVVEGSEEEEEQEGVVLVEEAEDVEVFEVHSHRLYFSQQNCITWIGALNAWLRYKETDFLIH